MALKLVCNQTHNILNVSIDPEKAASHSADAIQASHLLYDAWVDDATCLQSVEPLRGWLIAAAQAAGATIVGECFHQFRPYGVTGVLVLAESHLSIHTWPEKTFASIDVFTCGKIDPQVVVRHLRARLPVTYDRLVYVERSSYAGHATTKVSGFKPAANNEKCP